MSISKKKIRSAEAIAFAPATVANLAVGFDVLGLAIGGFGDFVKAKAFSSSLNNEADIKITKISAMGIVSEEEVRSIPTDINKNTATVGLRRFIQESKFHRRLELEIVKGIPLGSGLGGSAASSVASLVAVNSLLPKPYPKDKLLSFAIDGEAAASGSRHGDNVAPALLGGLVLCASNDGPALPLEWPSRLRIIVLHPGFRLDTKKAREVLPQQMDRSTVIKASAHLATTLLGLKSQNTSLLKEFWRDVWVEQHRKILIPGFESVQSAAIDNGALVCSISGAGPAVFAVCLQQHERKILKQMKLAFENAGHKKVSVWSGSINKSGARIVKNFNLKGLKV